MRPRVKKKDLHLPSCPFLYHHRQVSQTRWLGKHEPAVCNLQASHYLICGYQSFSQRQFWILRPVTLPRAALIFALEKRLNCSTQTHTDTRMEFTQRNEAVRSYWKQTTTGDGEERERHTDRGIILFFFYIFLYRIPFSPLTLLGLTALCRFSIHLSLSAAERHAKHLVPDAVVTWGYSQW